MKIEYIEDSELDYDTENYDKLKTGVVIFPEDLKEAEFIKDLYKILKSVRNG